MHLGFQTVVWGGRIDDLDHMLAVVKACGYEGVEFAQSHRDIYVREGGDSQAVGSIENLKARLDAHGLQLIGLAGGTLGERTAFCGSDRSAYLYLDAWSGAHAAALKGDTSFLLALHPHWFMPVRRLRHAEEVMAKWPNLNWRIVVDTAHAVIAEDDPVAAIEKHFVRLASVHIKDWKPDFGRWSHRYAHGFCPPGEGIVPVEKVLETLHRLKFNEWVILEQDHFEISREQTALACALWAAKWAGKYFNSFSVDTQQVADLEGNCPPPLFPASTEHFGREVKMARELILAPSRGPEVFYPSAVRVLRSAFRAEGVMLWSYNPFVDELYLLAAALGEHLPHRCETSHTRKDSLIGAVIEGARVLVYDLSEPGTRSRFADQELLKSLKSRWMIIIPVLNASNPHHIRYILSVFPGGEPRLIKREIIDRDRCSAERYGHQLSVWADYLTDEMCSAAAGATAHLCGEVRNGVVPFVNALMTHIKCLFQCEAVCIFLVDESRKRLEPVGETESQIEWDEKCPKNEHYYHKGEGLTGKTWEEREMQFSSHGHKGKSFEKTPAGRRGCLTAPLARRGGDLLGVVRLHNKIPRGLDLASTAFTDDDAARLDAVIQTALPHLDMLISQRRQSFALTRLAHELQNPLVGIAGAADLLREGLKERRITDLKREFGADYIDDILSYQALMSRLVKTANLFGGTIEELKPRFERTDMATHVIIPVRNQLKALLKQHRLPDDRIYVAQFQGTIPWLEVDRSMFQQVFFNLFVNAIKYHDGADSFKVEVKARMEGTVKNPTFYVIDIEDWGIGLDKGDDSGETMFLPGVRGTFAAKYRDVGGTGIGLAVVKSVVEAHCGTVEFSSPRKPTRVTIRLPAELRHMSPRLIRSKRI